MPKFEHDKIIVIEDDDWYAPDYVQFVSPLLERADLVGLLGAKVYYLDSRSWHHYLEHKHASWCLTAFYSTVIPEVWRQLTPVDDWRLDVRVWQAWSGSTFASGAARVFSRRASR